MHNGMFAARPGINGGREKAHKRAVGQMIPLYFVRRIESRLKMACHY
jgi:hypothetical protein